LWPGVIAAVVLALAWFVIPSLAPETMLYGMFGSLAAILSITVWWLFFSRARWFERLGALVLIVVAMFVTYRLIDISIANGAMGYLFPVLATPVICLALVAWAVAINRLSASRRVSNGLRWLSLVATILVACGAFTLLRTGGFTGDFDNDFHWRWSKTPEQRLLAQASEEPAAGAPTAPTAPAVTDANKDNDWPGFRGPERNGIVFGTRIKSDWTASPPVELWRKPVGPGWSSFAVHGDLVYTQEQRGNDEVVACYNLSNGKPVWRHSDAARFWESNAGAGPRGTPTLSNGRVYTLGATGILNVLDAGDGAVKWSRNAASDTKTKIPGWGFSGSPLVVGDKVIVATAGKLVAYDLATGEPRWFGPDGGAGYSSPQLSTINGVQQILLVGGTGVTSVTPNDGKVLWEHKWEGVPIVQPAVMSNGDVLISVSESSGIRNLAVAQGPNGWTVQERWTTEELNPYFNDFVVRDGYAYGFNWNKLSCIDLKDGSRKWKGGQYGHGQIILLSDQKLLLVVSELGDLALVKADPNQFTELGRVPAIKGKTWNHPVLVRDVLLVRNGEEMAAFRLPLEDH
jgi:outer membrane protein assembly factor BamB